MKATTTDVINIIPFEPAFKEKLLSQWETLSEDQRFELEQIIWDTYADLYQTRYDTNTQLAFQEASKGNESLDSEFGQRVREKTDKEFEDMFEKQVPAADLADAREKLQDLIEGAVNIDSPQGSQNDESDATSKNTSN